MLHVRVLVPSAWTEDVLATVLERSDAVHVAVVRGAGVRPPGDLVECDVPRESASYLLESLRALRIEVDGSISVEEVDLSLSAAAERAEDAAPGLGVDAVVWEQIEARTTEETSLSVTFLAFMTVSTLLAGVAILLDSAILLIGAMVVGPDFGPLAGLSVGVIERRARPVVRSLTALLVGFGAGILAVVAGVALLRLAGRLPSGIDVASRSETAFIAQPDEFAVVVGLLAGVAGMLSLTASKSAALVGVLVSVTTVPAAADIGVSIAAGFGGEAGRAGIQLGLNVGALLLASILTLAVQRAVYRRRRPRSEQ